MTILKRAAEPMWRVVEWSAVIVGLSWLFIWAWARERRGVSAAAELGPEAPTLH